jgi:hypothetical protein
MKTKEAVVKKPVVKQSVTIEADRSIYSIYVKGPNFWEDDSFEFTIDSDGDITLNDNIFSSKKQAADVLEAMAKFLKK